MRERERKEERKKEENYPDKLQNENAFGFNTKNMMK